MPTNSNLHASCWLSSANGCKGGTNIASGTFLITSPEQLRHQHKDDYHNKMADNPEAAEPSKTDNPLNEVKDAILKGPIDPNILSG